MFAFMGRHKNLTAFAALLLALALFVASRTIGPHRFYEIDFVLTKDTTGVPVGPLEVGVAERDITPVLDMYDPWTDVDGNGRFDPEKDTYVDKNGNGTFDFVWVAGFNISRPAKRVDDRLLAQAMAFRNNGVTTAMVSIDSIGIMHHHFISIRKRLAETVPELDHVMFSSSHSHNTPDTMGIWSYGILDNRYDHAYMAMVEAMAQEAVEEAVSKLAPVDTYLARVDIEPEGMVDDSRLPHVYDLTINNARFTKRGTDETVATLVSWGCHPEAYGGSDGIVSADFVHYWREAVEKGLSEPNGVEGFGGVCMFLQGQVGGLMTQLHTTVPDRNGSDMHERNSIDKARAQGENLALKTFEALAAGGAWKMADEQIAVAAKTVYAPIGGTFTIPIFLGIIHPGWYWGKAKTEINAFRIGEMEFLTLPGESYPEMCEGGVESPDGADFPGPPIETPPLRAQVMKGKLKFVINLANDEIGYLVPRTQWDTKAPYAYGRDRPQYGEQNSPGPQVTPVIHAESKALLERLHAALGE